MKYAFLIAAITAGALLATVGVVEASGNNGWCAGEWTQVYDPNTDSWSYEFDSFTCEPDICPPGQTCTKKTFNVLSNGAKEKMCGCMDDGSGAMIWGLVYIGHTPNLACDAKGHYPPGSDWAGSASCHGACPPGTGICIEGISASYYEGGTYKRDFFCHCD